MTRRILSRKELREASLIRNGVGAVADLKIEAEDIDGQIDDALATQVPVPRVYVNALSLPLYTLTNTATKQPWTNGTLTAGDTTASWEFYDSGSGVDDSIRYLNGNNLGTIEVDVTASFRVRHTTNDGRALQFRALCYNNDTLVGGGHLYATTAADDDAIAQVECTTRVTVESGDYLNYRVSYVNSSTGSGGVLIVAGAYTHSGSTNITTSTATVGFDTSEESDTNLTLNGDGSVSIAVAGTYTVSYSCPVEDDGSTGNPRAITACHAEYDADDDGAGYVDIPQSFSHAYVREAVGGGVASSFLFTAAAGSRVRLEIINSDTTDSSTVTGKASLSINRIPGDEGGSESGRVEPYGYQVTLRQAE
jgi:hypothetical protein